MQNIYTPQLFSPYSVSKQNQPNQVQRSTPFDEDNDTSKSGSQIVNQVQVSPHNPINLDELFDDKQIKSKNDIPFWEYDYEQEQPQGKGNNSEIDLFNLDQNFQNQIKGETSQNQNLKPQGFEQKQEQIKRDQNEILDAFDEDFEQFPQIIPQQNNTDQIPKAIDKQRNFESQNNYLQDNIFDNPQPPLKTNLQMTFHPQNDNYFQETKIGNQQNKDETQQSIVQFFDQQQDNNLWFEPNNNTPPNQSQVFQSQKSLSEKYVPNSQNTSQIKQQPQQPQQVEYYNGTQFMFQQQEETKKQNQVINFDIESDQEAKQQKSMNNSQQDYSEVIWKQQQTTKNQLIDFYPFQVSNNFDINKELNQSDQLHQWPNQNNDDINFRQQYNNNQFNINFSQNDFFNYEQDKKDQNFFINNNQVIQSAKSIDKIQFNQQDNITQTSGQNQFNVQKPQNTVQSESDDGSNHFQPNFQNLLNNDFGTYDWNTQQIKIKSESQHSVQDLEQRNNGWDSSQFGYFFKEFPKNENDNKSQEKSVQSYNEQVFEPINFLSQQGSQTYQQGEQSINNSQSHTQFVFGTQTQDQDNNFKQETQQSQEQKNDNIKILDQYVQDRQYLNNQYDYDFAEQKVNMIDDSKIIQQSQNQTQSFEFPSSFQMGIHSVRESKEDNKELSFVEQVMELLKPKIAEMAQNLSNEFINTDFNFKQEGQARLFQGIQDIFQKEKKRVELDLLNQQVQIIKDIVIKYDNKTEQLQEQFIRMKEEQERERQNKINISVDSIQLRKSQDIDQQIEESPIQNIQLQVSPNLFTPKTSQEKPYVPFQLIHQTQSKYLNESGISQDIKEEDLIKFKTNYIFQRNLLKGLYTQFSKEQCLIKNIQNLYCNYY